MSCAASEAASIPQLAPNERRETTLDAFHRERFWLVQPAGRGHRAGMDAMVLAAAVPTGFYGRLADLGAGAGAAGFAVASRCDGANVTLVERDEAMLACAGASIGLEQNRHLRDRMSLLACDVTLSGAARVAAGLDNRSFDFVVMNPPFNDRSDRASPDPLKRDAHVMDEGLLDAWIRTASAISKPGGGFALIARPASLGAILSACEGRFGGLRLKPILPRPDADAIRIVVRAAKGSRAAMSVTAPLTLHRTGENRYSAEADAILNGRASLFGDL